MDDDAEEPLDGELLELEYGSLNIEQLDGVTGDPLTDNRSSLVDVPNERNGSFDKNC